ncbi:hypothetical protein [Paenibacillus methanolicus]|uniref:Uncharacterized protein n=1 Tax=Paenibacillus methanolicus TaxID=582686 RepID=A0A5S5C5P6_9BACL|nr:hypothetical protein [Paenibacillus methanolicus]TYP74499.1 hypothetical protein BCM02_10543 [Paenibacillus methanolicus]
MKLKVLAVAAAAIAAVIAGVAITQYEPSLPEPATVVSPTPQGEMDEPSDDQPDESTEAARERDPEIPGEALLREINEVVGVRELLSDMRKEAAVKEWQDGEDDIADLEDNPPRTLPELLAEVEGMYQGETKYTQKRVQKLAAIKENDPKLFAQYNKYFFSFPAAPLEGNTLDANMRKVKENYEIFHQYIDRMVAPVVQSE